MTAQATTLDYFDGDTPCTGTFYTPEGSAEALPLVLVCPAWDGLVQEVYDKAEKLSEAGYITCVIDVLGEGKAMSDIADLQATMGPFILDRAMLLRRLNAAVDAAKTIPGADTARIGVIGYCFGGGGVLELARAGAPVAGVVSFHGNLNTPDPKDAEKIKGKVLVCHGADDPIVPDEQVAEFMNEMRAAKVDWQLIAYGGAVHSFTDPTANRPGMAQYNEKAAKRSWKAMRDFFDEIFADE